MCEAPSWRLELQSLSPTLHKHLYMWSDYRTNGVQYAKVSINSCQYPCQEIKNINPVAQTRCPNKNIHAQTDKLFIPKGLYLLISCEEFNHR